MHIQNRHHFIGIFALYSTCLYLTFPRSNIFQFLHSYQFLYWFSFHNQSGDICFCAVRHDICQSNRAHHDLDLVGSSFCMIPPLNSQCLLRSKTRSTWLTAQINCLSLRVYLDKLATLHRHNLFCYAPYICYLSLPTETALSYPIKTTLWSSWQYVNII